MKLKLHTYYYFSSNLRSGSLYFEFIYIHQELNDKYIYTQYSFQDKNCEIGKYANSVSTFASAYKSNYRTVTPLQKASNKNKCQFIQLLFDYEIKKATLKSGFF
jgi:hypothetical protein